MNFLNQFSVALAVREVPNRRIEFNKIDFSIYSTFMYTIVQCSSTPAPVASKDRAYWRVFISCHGIDSIYFDRCIVIVHVRRTASE